MIVWIICCCIGLGIGIIIGLIQDWRIKRRYNKHNDKGRRENRGSGEPKIDSIKPTGEGFAREHRSVPTAEAPVNERAERDTSKDSKPLGKRGVRSFLRRKRK